MSEAEGKPITVADALREFTGTSLQMVLTVEGYVELLDKADKLYGRIRGTAAESIDSVVERLPQSMLVTADRRLEIQVRLLQSIRARVAKELKARRRLGAAAGRAP